MSSDIADVFYTTVSVKVNKDFVVNVMSVYFPAGPKNNNTDWLKSSDTVNSNWIILGDFNAHSPVWEKKLLYNIKQPVG
jgi:hypothetical protein